MGKDTQIKILHLETALEWRGGQQQIVYLLQGLIANGIQTVLACSPKSEIMKYCRKNNLPVLPVEIGHGWDFSAARQIARFMQENAFNILHAHSSHALSLSLLVKTMRRSVKLVASRRVDFSVNKPVIGSLKYNNRLIDRIVCISENIARVLQQDGVDARKLTVIHSGIDVHRFVGVETSELRAELNISSEHLIVGTVAALVGHKDYPTLMQAAQLVCKKRADVTFLAVGDGGDRGKLNALHKELGLGDCFRFVGFRSDLQRFYNLFDIFVLSSYLEGLGTSVLDALACGLPVVATRAGGIPEMIVHEQNGLLVEKKNPRELAAGIERLINDDALRERLSQNARQSVKAFSYENMVQKHLMLYRELLD